MERMTSPNYSDPLEPIEKTLVIIKPDGMIFREEIMKRIVEAGFKIIQSKIVKLTPEQASELYVDQFEKPTFPLFIVSITEGPIQAMCLAKPKAILELLALIGSRTATESMEKWPGSLRSHFGSYEYDIENAIEGSADETHARHEIRFFFPNSKLAILLDIH